MKSCNFLKIFRGNVIVSFFVLFYRLNNKKIAIIRNIALYFILKKIVKVQNV